MMRIGLAGAGPLAAFVARQVAVKHQVLVFDTKAVETAWHAGVEQAKDIVSLTRDLDVVLVCSPTRNALISPVFDEVEWTSNLAEGTVVVDLGQGDPERTRAIALRLQERGVTLVDAALHTEDTQAIDAHSAILCGGPRDTVEALRSLLEEICPQIVYCGDVGSGHAARLVVASIAACNRLITYECAAMGFKNGLTIEDMATVLNRSSGANSASARVLPALASGSRTSDATLGAVASDLALASSLAMRCGAPMLIATLARSMLDAASNRLGEFSILDDIAWIWKEEAGLPVQST
jgi:3-hydroxyisobutyrate dehydrogenase